VYKIAATKLLIIRVASLCKTSEMDQKKEVPKANTELHLKGKRKCPYPEGGRGGGSELTEAGREKHEKETNVNGVQNRPSTKAPSLK
jgi:hypothetical protein